MIRPLLLITFFSSLLWAQGFSFHYLNDEFYDTDEERTGGWMLLYQYNDNWSFHMGQDIYTPKEKSTLLPVAGDRPYNAWLYAGFTYQKESDAVDMLYTLMFDVGTRGPRALGEEVQNGLHKLVDAHIVQGWDSQTDNEYGNLLTLGVEYSLLEVLLDSRKELSHISTHLRVDTGTIWHRYSLGVSLAFGYNTPYYNSLITFPEDDTFYIFSTAWITYVDQDRMLEDNTGYNVVKEDIVKMFEVGVNWDIDNVRLRISGVRTTEEFTTQLTGHQYAWVEITVGF